MPKRIVIIGSTGSVGRQTLDVINRHPARYKVEALACYSNIDLLAAQIAAYNPKYAAVFDIQKAAELQIILNGKNSQDHGSQDHGSQNHGSQDHGSQNHGSQDHGSQDHGSQNHGSQDHGSQNHGSQDRGAQDRGSQNHGGANQARPHKTTILAGSKGWQKIATLPSAQKIVFACSGVTALQPLLTAIRQKKEIALASKELLVTAGERIMRLAKKHGVKIIPIDSEHSAIFQCLRGENPKNIEKIILTCSGGPFCGYGKKRLARVTKEDALNHPVWKMGKKISIDSATLMNKALEIIEAKYLFNLEEKQVEIIIHPEGIIHSMVVFRDGSVKAQMACPDMRIPISYALSYPDRIETDFPRPDFLITSGLTFCKPDLETFEGPRLAMDALKKGGRHPALLNAANSIAVEEFLADKIKFDRIYPRIKKELAALQSG